MQIRLLSSHSQAPQHTRSIAHDHLPDDLSTALREHGHHVDVDLLADELNGHEPTSLAEGAIAGRKLAAEKLSGDHGQSGDGAGLVLHALDPVAWAAALTVRSRVDVAVVLRFTPTEPTIGLDSLIERRAQRACLRAADAIAATVEGDRKAAVRAGVENQRALVVPDPVGLLSDLPASLARSPGTALLSLSGIGPGSGIEPVLTAMRWLPGHELVVAGPGTEADTRMFEARSRALGLRHRVRWLGWVDRQQTARLIDAAALLLCPSPLAGPVGAVEAMARCRAVAAVDGGRAAEIVVPDVTGAILPNATPALLGAALRTVLKNPFQLEAMGLAGRERALSLFAPARTVSATERAYRVALGAA